MDLPRGYFIEVLRPGGPFVTVDVLRRRWPIVIALPGGRALVAGRMDLGVSPLQQLGSTIAIEDAAQRREVRRLYRRAFWWGFTHPFARSYRKRAEAKRAVEELRQRLGWG